VLPLVWNWVVGDVFDKGIRKAYSIQPYANNDFSWYSEVPSRPEKNDVVKSKMQLIGTGGIKVNAASTGFGKYQVAIDGSGISGSSVSAAQVDHDFNASLNSVYFVSKPATCALPSAVDAAGKEVLVWNVCSSGGTVKYGTSAGQKISGSAPGAISNSTAYKLDRFMSDGTNWVKE
jgi:hypothetical protein